MFAKLLVPLDGSPEAATALPAARTLAAALGASMRVVRVVPDQAIVATAEAATNLRAVERELAGDGIVVSSSVAYGDPAEQIVAEAERYHADFIVMATHGRTGLSRAVLGSVADGVLTHSHVPVVLVRPGGHR